MRICLFADFVYFDSEFSFIFAHFLRILRASDFKDFDKIHANITVFTFQRILGRLLNFRTNSTQSVE